ncbi:MAG: zinc metallopeptidase [Vampirovibrionales bacterium]|nr:zinc metallopeptidase [Vampirovibrionales bacterium]
MFMMHPGYSDPIYMVVMLIGAGLSFLPQLWVEGTYKQYAKVPAASGMTGLQVAQRILAQEGIRDVAVEMTPGRLSDHYDPSIKVIRLSPDNYHGNSIAGITISAHEVGHAIQHAVGYYPVVMRSQLAPLFGLGSQLGPLLFFAALFLGYTSAAIPQWSIYLAVAGVALFSLSVVFHIVTLPVEINASRRAMAILSNGGMLQQSELPAAKKILTAAAFTYVAVALHSLIQLAYYVFRLMGLTQRSRD